MKNLITKFNEYGYKGPEKTIGFSYSYPTEKFKIMIPFNYNEDNIKKQDIINKTRTILKDFEVFEFDIDIFEDETILKIMVTCYSEREANNIAKNLIKKLSFEFTLDINLTNNYVIF